MGRKRKVGTEWLPPQCYEGRSAYEYRPKVAGKKEIIRLCSLDCKQHTVWNRYEEEKRKILIRAGSVEQLFIKFFESPECAKLAASTIKQYQKNAHQLIAVFGKTQANAVKPEHLRKYMDLRGQSHEVSANREKSFMSRVYSWAYERGQVTSNPCKGVRKFTEKSRDRYITDEEYSAIYECGEPIVKAVLEISYCCAARVGDVLNLQARQLTEEGIFIKQEKTGKEQIKAWSPRLRKAIELARSIQKVRSMNRIVANERGTKLSYDAFRHRWNKAKMAAQAKHPNMKFDFTFHDNKGKSISDYEGDKQKFSGHKSHQMVATYDRKTDVVDTH